MENRQSPCPHRCFDDLGSAYAMGCLGGAAFHLGKGMWNAPRGDRLRGGYQQVVLKAPTLGGNFAVWGGLFSAFDCGLTAIRKKEDPLNAIAAGALTGGTLAARAGPKAALANAAIGGMLLAVIEGMGFFLGRMMGPQQAHAPVVPGTQPGLQMQGGLFGAPGGAGPISAQPTLAMMQPRRTLTSTLEDPAAEHLSLDEELPLTSSLSSSGVSTPFQPSSTFRSPNASMPPVTYTASVEFSSDDFTFNDQDDFEEEAF